MKAQFMYSPKMTLSQFDPMPAKSILYKTESKFAKYTSMINKSPDK